MLSIVRRRDAMKQPTQHQFVPGFGYVAHGTAPELPRGANGTKNCEPLPGTKNGSRHLLRPPTGTSPMVFTWIAAEHAWASARPEKGNRLAWTAAHMTRAGWEYVGPA